MQIIPLHLVYTSKFAFVSRSKTEDFANGGGVKDSPQWFNVSANVIKIDQYKAVNSRTFYFVIGY